jgi:predicted aconitase with swiveling domain
MSRTLHGRALVAGSAEGAALVSARPISLWGALDPNTGELIDRRHDRCGEAVTGKVFVFPSGKGSSTGSAILLESIRAGTAPAAIVTARPDPIAALGAIVADELYHRTVPIVVLAEEDFASIQDGDFLTVRPDGTVEVNREQGAEDNAGS